MLMPPALETAPPELQPDDIEFHLADGIFVKQMALKQAGIVIPQHAHSFDHHSFLAVGSVRVVCEGELLGDFTAPTAILIRARAKHTFISLEPSLVYCIHRIGRTGEVEIFEPHDLNLGG